MHARSRRRSGSATPAVRSDRRLELHRPPLCGTLLLQRRALYNRAAAPPSLSNQERWILEQRTLHIPMVISLYFCNRERWSV